MRNREGEVVLSSPSLRSPVLASPGEPGGTAHGRWQTWCACAAGSSLLPPPSTRTCSWLGRGGVAQINLGAPNPAFKSPRPIPKRRGLCSPL